MGREIPPLCP
ncbi:hypothetical protein P4O66_013776 [Electrophorus voltai]|uniref:Uncharacterized protein n=1 Tax=Electrophorus voltai TaxID=2609070 RepID=A0AAD8Z5N8_9TELE|nr:hypothetical protein P4O66_013776 [Electrophorus voltai]